MSGTAPKRILAIMPHPDDEALFIGGTLARYSREAHIRLIIVASGDRGKRSARDTAGNVSAPEATSHHDEGAELAALRREETIASATALGIHEVEFMDWPDRLDGVPYMLRCALRRRIAHYDPHVVLAMNEAGTTMNPDHSWVAIATMEALREAAAREGSAIERFLTFTLPEAPHRFNYWGELSLPEEALTIIDVSAHSAARVEACLQHETQAHWSAYLKSVNLLAPARECFAERWSRPPGSWSRTDLLAAAASHAKAETTPLPLPDPALYTSSAANFADEIRARAEAMQANRIRAVILASGYGRRMDNPGCPKSLELVGSRPILHHALDALACAEVDDDPIVVIGPRGEQIRAAFPGREFVDQGVPRGTGHALAAARPLLEETGAAHAMVIYGDMPLLSGKSLRGVMRHHLRTGAALTLGVIRLPHFDGIYRFFRSHGRIARGNGGRVSGIIEFADAPTRARALREVNPGIFCFRMEWLRSGLERLERSESTGELYLTDLVRLARQDGAEIEDVEVPYEDGFGVNTPEELAWANQRFQIRAETSGDCRQGGRLVILKPGPGAGEQRISARR